MVLAFLLWLSRKESGFCSCYESWYCDSRQLWFLLFSCGYLQRQVGFVVVTSHATVTRGNEGSCFSRVASTQGRWAL